MNQSKFIKDIYENHGIDFNDMWAQTMKSKNPASFKRAIDDHAESLFWKSHSKKYDKIPSLYDYAPETYDKLVDLIGHKKRVLEFGCGTGKFTIPMSKISKHVTAADFSSHMLRILECKLKDANIENVQTVNSKFENLDDNLYDSIFCVNANYRIRNIESAIKKMNNMARERVVIVWTMQRSIYDDILNKSRVKGLFRNQEYIYLVNILYKLGIDPCLEIKDVIKPVEMEDFESRRTELKNICREYGLDCSRLLEEFDKSVTLDSGKAIYKCKLKVCYIYFKPDFKF